MCKCQLVTLLSVQMDHFDRHRVFFLGNSFLDFFECLNLGNSGYSSDLLLFRGCEYFRIVLDQVHLGESVIIFSDTS